MLVSERFAGAEPQHFVGSQMLGDCECLNIWYAPIILAQMNLNVCDAGLHTVWAYNDLVCGFRTLMWLI